MCNSSRLSIIIPLILLSSEPLNLILICTLIDHSNIPSKFLYRQISINLFMIKIIIIWCTISICYNNYYCWCMSCLKLPIRGWNGCIKLQPLTFEWGPSLSSPLSPMINLDLNFKAKHLLINQMFCNSPLLQPTVGVSLISTLF
jgi:hypothetical protein